MELELTTDEFALSNSTMARGSLLVDNDDIYGRMVKWENLK